MSGLALKLRGRVGLRRPISSTAEAAQTWNNYSGDHMRAEIVALILRTGLVGGAAILFLFLWYGTGAERSPVGLMIGLTVAGLAALWWIETQIKKVLKKAEGGD